MSFILYFLKLSYGSKAQNELGFILLFRKKYFFIQKLSFLVKAGLQKNSFSCFNDSPSKMMKNAFYPILKALFVLNIFKLLSGPFGHVEKMAELDT